MLDKGKISSITADGDKSAVIPSYTDSAVTFPLVIPESLKGNLNVNDSVLYAMFEDNTGIIIGRADGNDGGNVEPITYSLRTMAMVQPEPCVEIILNCDKGNSSKACLVGDGATSVSYDEESEKIRISTPEITVDSALSDTSENPVQNKVLSERFSKLVLDINDSFDAVSKSLNGKASADALQILQETVLQKADIEHTHEMQDVTGLQTALSGKAPKTHGHAISDITSLEDSLKNKGDMFKSVYDSNNDGKVDGAENADDAAKLGGKTASEILTEFLQSDELNDYIQKHKYDVGDIYTTTNSEMNTAEKVAAKFGGTWVAWGSGRVPVGMGTGSDGTTSKSFSTVESTGGEYIHKLTIDEMPSHGHSIAEYGNTNNLFGPNYTFPSSTATSTYKYWGKSYTHKTAGYTQHNVNNPGTYMLYINSAGGGLSHNNIQPYVTVYYWKRTA